MLKFFVRLVLVAAILTAGYYVGDTLAKMKKPPALEKAAEIPLSVECMRVAFDDYTPKVDGYGTVRSARRVLISPEVGGTAVYVKSPLEAGIYVEEGEVLFRIDSRTYKLSLESAEAECDALAAQIDRVKQQQRNDERRLKILHRSLELAVKRYDRLKNLYETQQVGTLSDVETAEGAVVNQENQIALLVNSLALYPRQLAELSASLASSEVRRNAAALDLEKTEVTAPFRGRLAGVSLEENQYLTPGTPVLTLVDDRSLEIPISLDSMEVRRWLVLEPNTEGAASEGWYRQVAGAGAIIQWTEAPEDFTWPARLDRVERFNPDTRTVIAVVTPDASASRGGNPGLPLAEGMFCTVEIPARHTVNCVRVPRTAVTHEQTVHLAEENRLRTRPVALVHEDADYAYIHGDLEQGELIIVTRLVNPLEGRLLEASLVTAPKDGE